MLQWLNLNMNNIGPDGAVAIAKALVHNNTLKGIDISRNPIDNEGGKAFAAMLQVRIDFDSERLTGPDQSVAAVLEFGQHFASAHDAHAARHCRTKQCFTEAL